jgi:hypothetical protein
MGARSEPGLNDPFDEAIDDAPSSLPADLRAAMRNVEIVVEDEPPDGQPLLGLYRGVPLPRRSSTYSFWLDHPFGNELGVTSEPFKQSLSVFDSIDRGT